MIDLIRDCICHGRNGHHRTIQQNSVIPRWDRSGLPVTDTFPLCGVPGMNCKAFCQLFWTVVKLNKGSEISARLLRFFCFRFAFDG
jgi:hypothetical protein